MLTSYELQCNRGSQRLGIVGAYNILVDRAPTDVVFLVHTDMYFAPGADAETARHLNQATVCTCTRIEPPLYPGAPHKIIADLGDEPARFQEEAFVRMAASRSQPGRYTEGIFAPVMCYKEDFLAVGGLDPAFAPQSREDSDLFYRMAVAGYHFRQSWSAFCYHFSGRGSRKKDGIASDSLEWQQTNLKNERNFIRRWGCSVRHDEFLKPIVPSAEPISLVALLGDEPDNVAPFLENMEPYFSEIVFVSDGPQPQCVRRIEEYVQADEKAGPTLLRREKIKVLERPLDGDFAAQRNFGNAQCQCEWVLHADLDERFDRQLLESLRDLILAMRRSDKLVCGFPRLNYLDGVPANDIPRQEWTQAGLKAAQGRISERPSNLDPQFRLMRRDVRWQGRVHETPEPLTRAPQQVMLWVGAAIQHRKTLDRQRIQDARYESIAPGASLGPVAAPRKSAPTSLRILMLTTEYPPAQGYGLGRYASELAEALAGKGSEVRVVTINYVGDRPPQIVRGVYVHNEQELFSVRHFDWVGETVLDNVRLLERSIEIVRRDGPFDVLVSHDWLAAHCSKAIRAIYRVPWLLVMHDTEVGKRSNRLTRAQAYITEMESWATRQADHVLTTSEFMRQEVANLYKVPSEKLSAVPCGINARRFLSSTNLEDFRNLFAAPNERLLVYSGRLSPMKGVEEMMEAFGILAAKDRHIRLVIAGEGPLREGIEKRLKETGLLERCYLTGWLGEKVLGALYGVADVVLVPSRYEPFGMVALEAVACGATVVASSVGGLAEIIQRSAGAIVPVPPGDPQQLAATTQAVLSERSHLKDRNLQGRERLLGIYSWERMAGEVSAILQRLTVNPMELAQRG